MKNNNDQQYEIRKARQQSVHAVATDVLVNPRVVEQNANKLNQRGKRKRRINYEKKIMNDSFIMNI